MSLWVLGYLTIALGSAIWGKFEINNERVRNPVARLLFGLVWPMWVGLGIVIFAFIALTMLSILVRLPFSRNPDLTVTWRDRVIYRNGQWVAKR